MALTLDKLGILFDMDGVIIDNHEYHFQSWQILAQENNITLTESFYKQNMNGLTMVDCMRVLLDREVSVEEATILANKKEALYRELYKPYVQPAPGLIAFLDQLNKAGIPYAIGTSAPSENVKFTLDGTNTHHYFTKIVDATMVTKGKPDPQVYLKCAGLIGKQPENCVVFEDAIRGIEAGKNSGAKVIGLATTHTVEEITPLSDLVIRNFEGLTIEAILNLF